MTAGAFLLGKIFISHSSADKPFVRRLARRIQKAGFDVWLDEHELLAGDRLGEKIAAAVAEANVIIVVVTSSSVKSQWLRYELTLATERMVKKGSRVIPAVVGEVEVPADLRGLLYADFRRSFRFGVESILSALRNDASTRLQDDRFLKEYYSIERVFRESHSVYKTVKGADRHYQTVSIPVRDDEGFPRRVVFERVKAEMLDSTPLRDGWMADFEAEYGHVFEPLYLVVSEREVKIRVDRTSKHSDKVVVRFLDKPFIEMFKGYAVVADISGVTSDRQCASIIRAARKELIDIAKQLPPSPSD